MGERLPQMLGAETEVACVGGRMRRYANLDNAASTPVMSDVWNAVEAFVPWYSSVHRGSGFKSQLATAEFEGARDVVARFVGARPDDGVVFVRNTTEAINVLAASLPAGTRVLSSRAEHHANMLAWRRHDVRLLPFTRSADELIDATERALRAERIDLVAVTGASNVTGEVWPVAELATLAHRHGAELFIDAAQLAPHRTIDMARAGIDHLALSGHKLYAPFGSGALVGRLRDGEPLLAGGGAIRLVTLEDVIWADAPDRYEAGSPNVIGVVALAAACRSLLALGMDAVAAHERSLAVRLWTGLAAVPGLETLTLWPRGTVDRVGVATFNLAGYRDPLLAAILSAEHDRGPPRLLLRASADDASAARAARRGRPPARGAARRPDARAPRRGPREHRPRHGDGGRRPARRGAARDRRARPALTLRALAGARRVPAARGDRGVSG